jgi:predicted Zn-dependent protease
MHYLITRIASFMLAFGLFIGCSTLLPSKKTAPPADHTLTREELQSELDRLDSALARSSEDLNPDLFYRKGYVLGELANQIDNPRDRAAIYAEMQNALQNAAQEFQDSDNVSGQQKVNELLQVKWSHEHNLGVQIIQNDSLTLQSEDYRRAAAHFGNASTILPDSAISYKLKAQAHYNNHQLDRAIATLEKARQNIDPLSSEMLEQLAFLYLETDQAEKAVEVYEEAESFSEENLNIIHGLANAYISVNNHRKAVELLDLLVQTEPENVIYAQARGTELYYLGAQKVNELIASLNPDEEVPMGHFRQADSLFSEAAEQLQQALDATPDDIDLQLKMANLHMNIAANYQRMLSYVSEEEAAAIGENIEDQLRSAIPLFESVADQKPELRAVWQNLYQIYTYLDMPQKAEEIEAKANQ